LSQTPAKPKPKPRQEVGMAEVPLPYAKNLELAAMPKEDRIAAAVLSTLGSA
jgi:pyruvate/2-oxoglutarate/acetoin dehydrogenase E1 component